MIKPDHILPILNQINNYVQFIMEKAQPRLHFLDTMINKNGTKIWMDIYKKPKLKMQQTQNNLSNHPWLCLINIPFPLARRKCTIVENGNGKEKCFKELKENIARTKIPKLLIEDSQMRAKEIPLEILR